ncbi:flagellar basal body L-ring protein FlgH [Erythrobacter sp. THAF29]|uniref:flagellar basal body L-ring protein FlgH n=1 Tax=Erythrobacter sp. THAF29 TaxID=2587851 RepID=UPI001269446E|nr:flagellar basal body L-ring protein FlgH [Erythrobacter sp. THAF29]QFT76693.1 Flagellar L-ring protein precursor [Erythrobacter sp. THAF29]
MTKLRLFVLPFLALPLSACLGMGGGPQPGFAAPPPPASPLTAMEPAPTPEANRGAIFQAGTGYAGLHVGTRARSLGDMVTIVLVENTSTSKSTTGQTDRDGGFSLTPPTAGPLSFLNPNALNAAGQGSFSGGGKAAQQSRLTGTVAVTIAAIYPNGTAEVVGEKQMSLSQGDEWVQFAGRIRLIDIDADNRLPSSKVANARIIYSGKGAVQQASRPGWLSRFFNFISPF